jgi:C4-dicarboxylate transporter DctM subunit
MNDPLIQGAVVGAIAIVLFLTGMPIAFALGLTSILAIYFFLDPSQMSMFGNFIFDSLNDFGLLAVPLFVLMGNLFGGSVASQRLFEAGEAWLAKLPGGLGMGSVLASAVFAALTGSSPATAAAIGRTAIPEMTVRGYSARIAAGAIAAGSTLGILIPPSVTLILYGIAADQSIGQLFAAGIVPGIVIALLFCVWIYIATLAESRAPAQRVVERETVSGSGSKAGVSLAYHGGSGADEPGTAQGYTWRRRFNSLVRIVPLVVLIVAVLAALYGGVATPSEAAAIGVVLVFLLVAVGYRGLSRIQFLRVLLDTTNQSTMILTITAFSAVIATVLSFLAVPQELAAVVGELQLNKWFILLMINVVLLILGMFLPPVSIIVMVTPILYPLVVALGFDPIWFGIIMTVNMEMGLITPPVGLNLFVIKGIAPELPLKEILAGALPYVGVLAAAIVLFSVFPSLVTWLPGILY